MKMKMNETRPDLQVASQGEITAWLVFSLLFVLFGSCTLPLSSLVYLLRYVTLRYSYQLEWHKHKRGMRLEVP